MIFVLAIIFASLSLVFLSGKGASLFVGHNTILDLSAPESCAKRWEYAFVSLRCSC